MKNNKKSLLNSHLGFSLMETVAVIAVSSLVMTGATYLVLDSQKAEKNQEKIYWLMEQKLALQRAVQSDKNWAAIKAANPNMNCFDNNVTCSAYKAPQNLTLPMDNTVLNGNLPTLGLDDKGNFCNSFDAAVGNGSCPIGLSLSWQAICNDLDCKKAQPKMQIKFTMKDPRAQTVINLDSYNITAYRDSKLQDLNDICTKMGGTLVGQSCNMSALNTQCDPSNSLGFGATFTMGFDAAGKAICGRPNLSQCASNEVLTGFVASGNSAGGPICSPQCLPTGPTAVNCQGAWGACSVSCGGGTQTYTVTTPAANGGAACAATNGQTQACNPQACGAPVACIGAWGNCSVSCGGGTQTFSISTPAQNGGAACAATNGQTQACNSQACNLPIDCQGNWGACNSTTGLETFSIVTAAANGGAACAATDGQTRNCDVNCVGSFSACTGVSPNAYKVFTITVTQKNGGTSCTHANGAQDPSNCNATVCDQASWCRVPTVTVCKRYTDGTWSNDITTVTSCGGANPPVGSHVGKSCPTSVPVCGSVPPPSNGGFSCTPATTCFAAGTQIQLADGKYKSIEKMEAGDQVISYDEITKTQRVDTVLHHIAHEARWQILHHFLLVDGTTLTSNDEHPFYIIEKDNWLKAEEIYKLFKNKEKVSFLNIKNKAVRVKKIKLEKKFIPVYNFEVQGIAKTDARYGKWGRGHNYYAAGILVHNKPLYENCGPGSDSNCIPGCPAGWNPSNSSSNNCQYYCDPSNLYNETTRTCCTPTTPPPPPTSMCDGIIGDGFTALSCANHSPGTTFYENEPGHACACKDSGGSWL